MARQPAYAELYLAPFYDKYGHDTVLALLDPEELRRVFTYDPKRGRLLWDGYPLLLGEIVTSTGRVSRIGGAHAYAISVGRVTLPEAFFIWMYHDGRLPVSHIYFLDRHMTNARIENMEDGN